MRRRKRDDNISEAEMRARALMARKPRGSMPLGLRSLMHELPPEVQAQILLERKPRGSTPMGLRSALWGGPAQTARETDQFRQEQIDDWEARKAAMLKKWEEDQERKKRRDEHREYQDEYRPATQAELKEEMAQNNLNMMGGGGGAPMMDGGGGSMPASTIIQDILRKMGAKGSSFAQLLFGRS